MRDSLDFFLAHIAFTRSDPLRHERSLLLLAQNYGQRFPFLREKIVAAQALASR